MTAWGRLQILLAQEFVSLSAITGIGKLLTLQGSVQRCAYRPLIPQSACQAETYKYLLSNFLGQEVVRRIGL